MEISLLESLSRKAVDVECKQLSSVVDGINSMINEMTAMIFNIPMTALLRLTKNIDDRVKRQVGFDFHYGGDVLTNLRQLSGGEADRLSLAVFLALNYISNFPLLLLDEPFATLDGEIRDQCLSAMRRVSTGKTIICVSHEDVAGRYDEHVELENEK